MSTQLRPDEKILYQTGLTPVIVFICAIGLLFCTGILLLIALYPSDVLELISQRSHKKTMSGNDFALYKFMAMSLGIVLGLFISVKWLYDYYHAKVTITDRRIIGNIPTALLPFKLNSLDIPLTDVQDVTTKYYQGSSYGYVIIKDFLERKTIFRNFDDPEELRRQIIEAVGLKVDPNK
jgi:hypothetical protein